MFAFQLMAQQPEIKDKGSYNEKKFDNGAKKVYIANFKVHFQVMMEAQDSKAATSTFRGGYKGAQKAALTVAIDGIDDELLQRITDKLYSDYISDLKSKGLEIITSNQVKQLEYFQDHEYIEGGTVADEGIPGTLSVVPTGYGYYYKKKIIKKMAIDTDFKLSQELDDAVIAKVTLVVPFADFGNSGFNLGESKVKINSNLRVGAQLTGSQIHESKKLVDLHMSENDYESVPTSVTFGMGKGPGLSWKSYYNGYLAEDFLIEGVVEAKKMKAIALTTSLGTQSIRVGNMVTHFYRNDSDIKYESIPVDAEQYENGVYNGLSKVLTTFTSSFLSNY
jgi:hypothetical protein